MMKLNKKGTVTLYIVFLISSIIILLIASFAAPLGVRLNAEMFKAGEMIYLDTNQSIQEIQNETIKSSIQGVIGGGLSNIDNNISVIGSLFQYGWILVLAITGLIVFLFTRSLVEQQQNQGGLF